MSLTNETGSGEEGGASLAESLMMATQGRRDGRRSWRAVTLLVLGVAQRAEAQSIRSRIGPPPPPARMFEFSLPTLPDRSISQVRRVTAVRARPLCCGNRCAHPLCTAVA